MEPPAEWRGEYSNSIARQWAVIEGAANAPGCVVAVVARSWGRLQMDIARADPVVGYVAACGCGTWRIALSRQLYSEIVVASS